jgi:putative inorganic carbon (hco3(-)) transporter
MLTLRRLVSEKPLGTFAVLWPLVFLAPLVPGLPKGSTSFPWRQELAIAALLTVTLVLLLRKLQSNKLSVFHIQRSESAIYLPLALFVAWSVASLFWSVGRIYVVHYSLSWAAYLICLLVMRQIARSPRLLRASLGSLAFVLSIISIASAIEFWSTSPELYQYSLVLRRSTGLGEPLAVALPIFSMLAINLRNRRAALLCGVTTVLAWLAVLQTLERAPLLGIGVSFTLIAAGLALKKAWRPRRPKQALILVGVLVLTTAFQTVVPGASSGFHRFRDWENNDANTQIRWLVWAISLEMLREHPVHGVGANSYEVAYPSARASYSARQPDSPLVPLQEEYLAQRAHNEYLQILAELGTVGITLFVIFAAGLIWLAIKALLSARNPLALGAVGSLATFAISSGGSSISFRWFSSGLLFFFAASLVVHFAMDGSRASKFLDVSTFAARLATAGGLAVAMLLFGVMSLQGAASTLSGIALGQTRNLSATEAEYDNAEKFFRAALRSNPYDGATHFDFGGWLDSKKRYSEAAQHLRFATENGFNSSTCFAYLASAEAAAGDKVGAEKTLAKAVRIYPRSVFLRVRHSIALAEIGKSDEATKEYEQALAINKADARGWRHLMCFGADSAYAAAKLDQGMTPPRRLEPQSWAYPASAEQASRPPVAFPSDDGNNVAPTF